ncbi:pyruvate kinase [Micromonospora sp. NPDC051543]|uniref:pyruvate kinase n=1 Tax=Micromonospora sp. NPDC051543 TaxID=3364287 RepID=UPI00379BA6C8
MPPTEGPRTSSLVASAGPAIFSPENFRKAIAAGASAIRVSASKYPLDVLAEKADVVVAAAKELERPVDLWLDLPGSKSRFTNDDFFPLAGLERVRVWYQPVPARRDIAVPEIGLTGDDLGAIIEPGDILIAGDGEDALRVESVAEDHCMAQPLTFGDLGRRKGATVAGKRQSYVSLTESDLEALATIGDTPYSAVVVSFVEDAKTIETVRAAMAAGTPTDRQPAVIAKVETRAGVAAAREIAEASDAVLLGRGDLLMDCGELDFYDLGKEVLKTCAKAGVPVIVGTQLMPSMSVGWLPNRSELAYLSHLIEKNVDGLMLAFETTVGKQPIRTIALVAELIQRYGGGPTRPMFPLRYEM